MSRQHLSCLPVAVVVLLLSVALGWLIVRLVTPDRPADPVATQTPITVIVVDPTRTVVLPASPTPTVVPTPPERILNTPVPPVVEVPTPTVTPTPEPTRPPTRTVVIQNG